MRIEHGTNTHRTYVGQADDFKILNQIIHAYLKMNKIDSRYQRINFFEDEWQIDYGSWSEFLWVTELPENAKDKYMEQTKC